MGGDRSQTALQPPGRHNIGHNCGVLAIITSQILAKAQGRGFSDAVALAPRACTWSPPEKPEAAHAAGVAQGLSTGTSHQAS